MTYRKTFSILALATTLSLAVTIVLPPAPALARSITLSPDSGFLGTKVTITGTGFQGYKDNYLYLYFANYWLKEIEVSKTGTIKTDFYVPSYVTPRTSYEVSIRDAIGRKLAIGWFLIGAKIWLDHDEGKIGKQLIIDGSYFEANKKLYIYFSSDNADTGDNIDKQVNAYKYAGVAFTDANGNFNIPYYLTIPGQLTDGRDKENVGVGEYYIYVTYYLENYVYSGKIWATAKCLVTNGNIELDPTEAHVGTEVKISGKGFSKDEKITIEYDGHAVGHTESDSYGQFMYTITVPESAAGKHVIAVTDESGNKHESEINIEPAITIFPGSEVAGKTVKVSGSGFAPIEAITIAVNSDKVNTEPTQVLTSPEGSFNASFIVPFRSSYDGGGTSKITITDNSGNTAEAQLIILPPRASINLRPITSLSFPGHVGMELFTNGAGFTANVTVNIRYDDSQPIAIATATTDVEGNFSANFTVPSSAAGSHTVTATDGIHSASSCFIMESEAPPEPMPSVLKVGTTTETEAFLDWEDVDDPSGVTYTLQIASDAYFNTVVLEKTALINSQYSVTANDRLKSTGTDNPYYWRVKTIDGAFNESGWANPGLLYGNFSRPEQKGWQPTGWGIGMWAILAMAAVGLAGLALMIIGFRRQTSPPQ